MYKIEYGSLDDRKVKLGLRIAEVIPAYERLLAADEMDVVIYGPDGKSVEPHVLRLAVKGARWNSQ